MSDSLQQRLDRQREESAAKRPPELNAAVERAIEGIRRSGRAERALSVGDRAPDFTLPNVHGEAVRLGDMLGRGPVVLAFYRGVWWPYCNLQLQAYQSLLPEITATGATLVAVSPMLPDNSLSMAEKHALEFEVLSDVGNRVARDYGIVFTVPDELREIYEGSWNILLPELNGDDSWELPIPGTHVIGRHGEILYAFVDPDYRRRAEPAAILKALHRA